MTITPQKIKHIKKQKQKNRRKRQKVRFLSQKRQILERESESFRERESVYRRSYLRRLFWMLKFEQRKLGKTARSNYFLLLVCNKNNYCFLFFIFIFYYLRIRSPTLTVITLWAQDRQRVLYKFWGSPIIVKGIL